MNEVVYSFTMHIFQWIYIFKNSCISIWKHNGWIMCNDYVYLCKKLPDFQSPMLFCIPIINEWAFLLLHVLLDACCCQVSWLLASLIGYVIVSLKLKFSNEKGWWASFYILICHLYIFFGKVSVQICHTFFYLGFLVFLFLQFQ